MGHMRYARVQPSRKEKIRAKEILARIYRTSKESIDYMLRKLRSGSVKESGHADNTFRPRGFKGQRNIAQLAWSIKILIVANGITSRLLKTGLARRRHLLEKEERRNVARGVEGCRFLIILHQRRTRRRPSKGILHSTPVCLAQKQKRRQLCRRPKEERGPGCRIYRQRIGELAQ